MDKVKNLCIYKITNKFNGYCYIGLTNDVNRRWNEHINKDSNSLIHQAIKRLGKDSFTFEILVNNISTYQEAARLEIFCINKYNSLTPRGYNKTLGGESKYSSYKSAMGHEPYRNEIDRTKLENKKKLKKTQAQARKRIANTRKGNKH